MAWVYNVSQAHYYAANAMHTNTCLSKYHFILILSLTIREGFDLKVSIAQKKKTRKQD